MRWASAIASSANVRAMSGSRLASADAPGSMRPHPTQVQPLTWTAGRCRGLGFDLECGHIAARRGAEHPPVLSAELGRALVSDAERGLGRVEPSPSISRRASWSRSRFGYWSGLIAVTPWKWRWNADGLILTWFA